LGVPGKPLRELEKIKKVFMFFRAKKIMKKFFFFFYLKKKKKKHMLHNIYRPKIHTKLYTFVQVAERITSDRQE